MANRASEPSALRPLQLPTEYMEVSWTQFWLKDSGNTISQSVNCGEVEHSRLTQKAPFLRSTREKLLKIDTCLLIKPGKKMIYLIKV